MEQQSSAWICENNLRKLNLLVGAVCATMACAVNAADFEKKISIAASVEHDSNPAMSDSSKDPVWIYSLVPQVQLGLRDEVNFWHLDAALLLQRHSNETVLVDREDPSVGIGWDRNYESGTFGIKADYQETSARVAELNNIGVFKNIKNTQKNKVLGAKWQHAIAPRWSVLTEAGYSDVSFSAKSSLDDYTLSEIRSKLAYENTEKLTTNLTVGYAKLNPDAISKDTDIVHLLVGADYLLSEELSITSKLGLYDFSGRQSDTDWQGTLRAEYATGSSLFSAGISRELLPGGVGVRKVDGLKLAGRYNISDRNWIGAEYSFEQFKKDNSIFVDKLNTQTLSAFYERTISDHWQARLVASHKRLDYTGNHPQGNVIGFTIVYDTLNF